MGTSLLVVPLLATTVFLLLATPAKAGLIQASPKLTKLRSCDEPPCLIFRQKRQDDPTANPPAEGVAAGTPPAEGASSDGGAAAGAPSDGGAAAGAPTPAPAAGPAAPAPGPAAGGDAAAIPATGLGEIPLPPVIQQMPNLPPNFPYPDVKVVQEVPIPTKPRKKLIPGGANPYPFPPIGPPLDPIPPPMEEAPAAPIEPSSPVEPEHPVAPIEPAAPIEPVAPIIAREPYPTPIKPDCKSSGYGPPQDWRFPKARGHKKCPPSAANSAMGNEVYSAGGNEVYSAGANEVNSAAGNEVVQAAPEHVSVNLRTVQRDEEAGGEHHTTVHPGGVGSATSVVCSMGTVVFAVVAYFLNVAI